LNTDEERKKLPANLKDQLAKMEKNTKVGGNGAMAFGFNLDDLADFQAEFDLENLPGFEMLFPQQRLRRNDVPAGKRKVDKPRRTMPQDGVVSIIEDDLTVSISERDGKKHCKALAKDGKVLFDGPIDTKAQRKNLPGKVRTILEDLNAVEVEEVETEGTDKGLKLKDNEEAR